MKKKEFNRNKLESKRPTFFLVGFVLALTIVYSVFQIKTYVKFEKPTPDYEASAMPIFNIPQTWQTPKEEELIKEEVKKEAKKLSDKIIEIPNGAENPDFGTPADDEGLVDIPVFTEPEVPIEIDIYALEKKPIFPGCESLVTEEERFKCFVQGVSNYVATNLKPCSGAFGITADKLYIQFIVDEYGVVTGVKALRGNDECNIENAIGVVKMLPEMKPGKFRGENVRTRFVLPINIK